MSSPFNLIRPEQKVQIEFKGSNEIRMNSKTTFILPKECDEKIMAPFIDMLFEERPIYVAEHCSRNNENSVYYSGVIKGFAFYFSYYNESGHSEDRKIFRISNIYDRNSEDNDVKAKINYIRSYTQNNYYLSVKCPSLIILGVKADGEPDGENPSSKGKLQEIKRHNIDESGESVSWDMDRWDYLSIKEAFDRYKRSLEASDDYIPREAVSIINQIDYCANIEKEACIKEHYEKYKPCPYISCTIKKEDNADGRLFEFGLADESAAIDSFEIGSMVYIKAKADDDRAVSCGKVIEIDKAKVTLSCNNLSIDTIESKNVFSGYLVKRYDNSQDRKRFDTINSIRNNSTPAKYIYKLFSEWDTNGYLDSVKDKDEYNALIDFVLSKCSDKYPPNKMQMEAIIKGILTKDVLMVQGPPGTGKTTVIKSWVEYFASRGKRVLVASQNNSAVDNVLSGLKERPDILRLGFDPEKVQESCRKYMISEKKKDNLIRLKQNTLKAAKALEKISTYGKILDDFRESYLKHIDFFTTIAQNAEELEESLTIYDQILDRINSYNDSSTSKKLWNEKKENIEKDIFNRSSRYLRTWDSTICKDFIASADHLEKKYEAASAIFQIFDYCYANCYSEKGPESSESIEDISDIISSIVPKSMVLELSYGLNDYYSPQSLMLLTVEWFKRYRITHKISDLVQDWHNILSPSFNEPHKHGNIPITRLTLRLNSSLKSILNACESYNKLMAHLKQVTEMLLLWDNIYTNIANQNEIFNDLIIASSSIVGSTCMGTDMKLFGSSGFDVVIVDEAGQIQAHNVIVPMASAPKLLMLGDHKQIPPQANSNAKEASLIEREGREDLVHYDISFFETMFEAMESRTVNSQSEDADNCEEALDPREILSRPTLNEIVSDSEWTDYLKTASRPTIDRIINCVIKDNKKTVRLNTQFRMPEVISHVVSQWFYENNYYSGYDERRFSPIIQGIAGTDCAVPFVIISTSNCSSINETHHTDGGYDNKFEAQVVSSILKDTDWDELVRLFTSNEIGIISPYSKQKNLIRGQLKKDFNDVLTSSDIDTAVKSLDSFQGQEKDLIIYDFVRSSSNRSASDKRIGFLSEIRRLNVAFTRPKKQLVLIGDFDYLLGCECLGGNDDEVNCKNSDVDFDCIDKKVIENCNRNRCKRKTVCEKQFSLFMQLVISYVKESEGGVYIEL